MAHSRSSTWSGCPSLESDPPLVIPITPHNPSFISLTVGHEEFGDQVNVPVSAPAHRLRGPLQQLKTLIQLQAEERDRDAPQGRPLPPPPPAQKTWGAASFRTPHERLTRDGPGPQAPYLLQGGDGGALAPIVGVPVHMQHLLPIHGHDTRQDTFLGEGRCSLHSYLPTFPPAALMYSPPQP